MLNVHSHIGGGSVFSRRTRIRNYFVRSKKKNKSEEDFFSCEMTIKRKQNWGKNYICTSVDRCVSGRLLARPQCIQLETHSLFIHFNIAFAWLHKYILISVECREQSSSINKKFESKKAFLLPLSVLLFSLKNIL